MSSNNVSYTSTLEKLRNDLHRDVVQTAGLKDITFDGLYEFIEPIETYVTYYNNDRDLKVRYIKVCGVCWDGDIVARDEDNTQQHLRYNQLQLEVLNDMLLKLRDDEKHQRTEFNTYGTSS